MEIAKNKFMNPSILIVGNFLSAKSRNRTIAEELTLRWNEAGYLIITTSRLNSRPLRLLDMLSTAFFQRKNYQIAYVEVYSGGAFLWAEMVSKLLDVLQKPYILALHGGNLPDFARRWSGRVKRLLQGAAVVVAPSYYLLEKLLPYRDDIILIPNPLDLKNYPFHVRSTPVPSLVWLRAFHDIYNPQMAPQAIANLRSVFPDIHLTMIGPDKGDGSFQKTQQLIEALGLQENIVLVPGILKSQVPQYLAQADIFINTTNIDNTPVSVMEAMACGLCIVSTNVGGIPYLLEDGHDSLLVLPDDADAMTASVRRILTEPGLAGKLSGTVRRKAEQFDWLGVLRQWEEIFLTISRK